MKNTPRVTGFVGGGNSPVPLSADEVNQILYRQASSAERPRPKMTFEKNDPVRIVAFNTAEHWAEDVSEDVARELRRRADLANEDLSPAVEAFVERHSRRELQLTLRLV